MNRITWVGNIKKYSSCKMLHRQAFPKYMRVDTRVDPASKWWLRAGVWKPDTGVDIDIMEDMRVF